MKIAVNTNNTDLLNVFFKKVKDSEHQIINVKVEDVLFDSIKENNIDAYVLSNDTLYFKRAVEFIKKNNLYIPVIGLMPTGVMLPNIPVDFYIEVPNYNTEYTFKTLVNTIFYNIETYIKTFTTLKRLTSKMNDVIIFNNCKYDPVRRLLYHKAETESEYKEVKKLSQKEGGILEILASNYKEVVKKEVILEKVWRKNDYFAGRSMDVYITYLRNTLRNNNINLTITKISGIGLILE